MKIYLDFSTKLQEELAANEINLEQIFADNSIEAKLKEERLPVEGSKGETEKALVPVIIASSIALISIANSISQILRAANSKPLFIEYYELEEIRDANNNVIFNNEGNPIFKKVKKIWESDTNNEHRTQIEMKMPGCIFKFSTKEK